MNKKHTGGNFDDFLKEEGIYDEVVTIAAKRVIAYQIKGEMKRSKITKTELANRMGTSRAALERLLDPSNPSVTIATLERAASALGKSLRIELA